MLSRARSWVALALVGVLLAACSSAGAGSGTESDAPNGLRVLNAGTVRALAEPGVTLATPTDGRLRGYGFAAVVTGVASAHQAGRTGSGSTFVAGPGDHLVVFTLTLTAEPTPDPVGSPGPSLSADLAFGGGHIDFDPSNLLAKGQAAYAASVPNGGGDVSLQLTAAGLTQAFSLTSLHRVGTQPVALYRDPSRSTITLSTGQTESIPADVPADDFTGLETLRITTATLSDFQPGDPSVQPADPTQAYLVITGTDTTDPDPPAGSPSGSDFVDGFSALPGSDLTLDLPGGQTASATHVGSTTNGLLDGSYFFTVPADLTSATLVITPGSQTGVEYPVFTGDTATIEFPQPATFSIDLPPVPAAPQPTNTSAPAAGNHSEHGEASSTVASPMRSQLTWDWVLLLIGIAILLLALLGLKWRRRRRRGRRKQLHGPAPFRPLRPIPLAPAPLALSAGPSIDPDEGLGGSPDPLREGADGAYGPTTCDLEATPAMAGSASAGTAAPPIIAASQPVEVLMLGPIEVVGWRVRPRRKVVTALLCYLCLHSDRPVSGDRLLTALWPLESERPEASRASLHTYASELRRSLPDGCLPDAGTTNGYLLAAGVASDWVTFTSLTDEADDAEPDAAAVLLDGALSLVRGAPFGGATSELFEWATTGHHIAAMEVAVASCAHRLGTLRLTAGDGPGAEEVALRGLVGVPDSALLHADRIRAATVNGDPAGLRRAWKNARQSLGEEGVARLVDELGSTAPVHQRTS